MSFGGKSDRKSKKSRYIPNAGRLNTMSESEIEANALSDPDNQPLSSDSLKKVRRKRG
jgi:hypothetical protein